MIPQIRLIPQTKSHIGNWADAVDIVNIVPAIKLACRSNIELISVAIVVEVRRRTKHTPQIRLISKQNQTLEIGRTP